MILAAVLLPIAFVGLVYMPTNDSLSKLKKQKFSALKDPISDLDVKAIQEEKGKLLGGYKELVGIYSKMEKEGSNIEKWFANLQIETDGYPLIGNFVSAYEDSYNRLDNKLKSYLEQGQIPEGWFKDPINKDEPNKSKANEAIKSLQKRFWIKERLVNTLQELEKQKLTPIKFHGLVFFKELSGTYKFARIRNFPGYSRFEKSREEATTDIEFVTLDGAGKQQFSKIKIADTITFGVEVELNYPDIFKFIHAFLDNFREPRMIVELNGLRISHVKWQSSDEIRRKDRTIGSVDGITLDPVEKANAEKKEMDEIKKNNMMLAYITFRVIDPDIKGLEEVEKLLNPEQPKGK